MRTCPSCKELNGDSNEYCYKCNAYIGPVNSYQKKVCPNCDISYPPKKPYCDVCGRALVSASGVDYDQFEVKKSASSVPCVETWMYIVGFLIPIVGLVLGCIQVAKNDKQGGRNLIITAIVSAVLITIVSIIVMNHQAKKAEEIIKDLQDSTNGYSYNYDDYDFDDYDFNDYGYNW